jgi:hypothetical protein
MAVGAAAAVVAGVTVKLLPLVGVAKADKDSLATPSCNVSSYIPPTNLTPCSFINENCPLVRLPGSKTVGNWPFKRAPVGSSLFSDGASVVDSAILI